MLPWAAGISAQTMTVTTRDGQTHRFATTDVEHVTFDMAAQHGPFQVEVSQVTPVSALLTIVPDNPDIRYYFDVCLRSDYELHGIRAIVEEYFISLQRAYPDMPLSVFLDGALSQGADSDMVTGLPCDTEMICYAIGVDDNGKCVGEPSVTPFRTLPGGDPADCTFEISYTGASSTELTVQVHPSDPSVRYWMGCYSANDWPGDVTMPMVVKNTIDEYAEVYGKPLEMVVEGVTFTGDISMVESGFQPDTPYYIYVYAMDKAGNPQGPLFKKRFVTTSRDYSQAGCTLKYRYFDGDELAAAYPAKFAKAKGSVVVQASFTPNELTENFAWALGRGDMTDETLYPEDTSKQAVLQGGYINVPFKELIAKWGDATFLYFGSDGYGVDGPLARTLVQLTQEGASPATAYDETAPAALTGTQAPLRLSPRATKGSDSLIWNRLRDTAKLPTPLRNLF